MSQKERVLQHLQENKTLDPLQAWVKLGVYRLSARVHDLREDGHTIDMTRKKVTNRHGEEFHVAEYRLHV